MQIINATRLVTGFTLGMEPSGRELLVVVVKGSFTLPGNGERVDLAEVPVPLVEADTFSGAPGFSSPMFEVDYAPVKRHCDVLVVGSAHAPQGRPAARIGVGLRIGQWQKSFSVTGDRRWEAGAAGIRPGPPTPFVVRPITYDVAFGGADTWHPDPAQHRWFETNPVGKGFHHHLDARYVDGSPMPNTEASDQPVDRPDGPYRPMSFGPVGRSWPQRARYAGTYDQHWQDHHFPFLPPDFDDRYYLSAPEDQQLAHPVVESEVTLVNLTADGRRQFLLPTFEAPLTVFPKRGERESHRARLDTIVFEPDADRFTMTWRYARPIRKDLFEIAQVLVGRKGKEWWQQREEIAYPIRTVPAAADSAGLRGR